MFSLLLLPPICGLCLFFGLLTAKRGPLIRIALTLVLTGLVAPIAALFTYSLLVELPVEPVFTGTALLIASLIWRLVPRLPIPKSNIRGICWLLVLTSCTLITVELTAAKPSLLALLHLSLLTRMMAVALPLVAGHVLLSVLASTVPVRHMVPKKEVPLSSKSMECSPATLPLLSRPLELVGTDAPYYPLAIALTAGTGPAAAFSCN